MPSLEPGGRDGQVWTGHPLGDDPQRRDWLVMCRVEQQDDRLVIAEIRIVPRPTTELESAYLRDSLRPPPPSVLIGNDGETLGPANAPPSTPAGGLTTRAARTLVTEPAFERAHRTLGYSRMMPGFTRETLAAPRQPGRRGRPDRFYAEIAAAYVAACDAGSRTPIPDVTRKLADAGIHYSKDAVRDLVHDARRRGLLTKPPRGKAGGRLTEKAENILSAISEEPK